jgi:L-ascorbate metabolism protein UlaG (beta-lactamase superfamily)
MAGAGAWSWSFVVGVPEPPRPDGPYGERVIPPTRFVGHATVLLRVGGLRVLTDPALGRICSGLTRVSRACSVPRVDLVLISHLHADHLDLPSLRRLAAPTVVVPHGAGPWLRDKGIGGVQELGAGQVLEVGDLQVTGTDCRHDDHRWPHRAASTRAHPVGYLIDDGEHRVYFAGDTDLFASMAGLGEPDLALLPVWGWGPDLGPGHLTPVRAAEAAGIIRPGLVMPIHWGTFTPPGFAWRMRRQLIDPPRELARRAAELAPGVRIAITEPGDVLAA